MTPDSRLFLLSDTVRQDPDIQEWMRAHEGELGSMAQHWFDVIRGSGEDVRTGLTEFATRHGVDEVMISPVAGAFDGEPMDAALARRQTLELLAA